MESVTFRLARAQCIFCIERCRCCFNQGWLGRSNGRCFKVFQYWQSNAAHFNAGGHSTCSLDGGRVILGLVKRHGQAEILDKHGDHVFSDPPLPNLPTNEEVSKGLRCSAAR